MQIDGKMMETVADFIFLGSEITADGDCNHQTFKNLYIFEINSLSFASFAIIFSHSEGCLFTLLIVSFVVKKLLILVRSHLFIFAFF